MHVEELSARDEYSMNFPQGVHDALRLDSSQRPAEERDVEPLARNVERLRVRDSELDTVGEPGRKCGPSIGDRLLVGIDAEHLGGLAGVEPRHPALAATDLDDSLAGEVDERVERVELRATGILDRRHGDDSLSFLDDQAEEEKLAPRPSAQHRHGQGAVYVVVEVRAADDGELEERAEAE